MQIHEFNNLPELIKYFSDERKCWDYLEQHLWNGRPVCPHCGSTKAYRMPNYKQFHCGNKKGCNKKFTVTVGTMYENTKISLAKWFAAIWLITAHKKGISSCQLARDITVTQRTAWFLLHRIREMVKAHNNEIKLSETVQMDESYYKGDATNRTKKQRKLIADGIRQDEPSVIFAMVNDKAVIKHVPNAERETLAPIVINTIQDKQTVVVTDGNRVYHGLDMVYKGHIIINHAEGEYKVGEYHTNTAEGLFSWIKRGIVGIYHFVSAKHIQRYLDEYCYKYNSRKIKDVERFIITIQKSKGRLKYKDLVKKL